MPITGTCSSRGDLRAERRRNAFEQHDVGAGVLQRLGVARHLFGRRLLAALHAKAADLVHRLRLQAECAHTAMSWLARNSTISTWPAPPSSLTILAPPSCIRRTALSSACSFEV